MTSIVKPEDLEKRIARLKEDHKPVGNSSFVGVTGNLFAGILWGGMLGPDSPLYDRVLNAARNLDAYLTLVEINPDFRCKEMREERGYFPNAFTPSSDPHGDYARHAVDKLGA